MVFVSLVIGWESGTRFCNQSQIVKQNQYKLLSTLIEIRFDVTEDKSLIKLIMMAIVFTASNFFLKSKVYFFLHFSSSVVVQTVPYRTVLHDSRIRFRNVHLYHLF